MSATIVIIGGRPVVVSLLWQTITGRKAKSDAKRIAKEHDDDLMCMRSIPKASYGEAAIQIGLSSTRELGKKARSIPSLAGALATVKNGTWIGAFALPSGQFWALNVINNAINPKGGDLLFDSVAELTRYITEQRKFVEWDYVVASGVAIDGAEEIDLEQILVSVFDKAPKLKPVGASFNLIGDLTAGRIFQIIALIGILIMGVSDYLASKKAVPIINPVIVKAPPPPPPWPTIQAPSALIVGCAKIISEAPIAFGGWLFSSLSCDDTAAVLQFKRTKLGTYNDVISVGGTLGQDNSSATVRKSIGKNAVRGNDPKNDMGIRYELADAVEAQGDHVEFHIVPPTLPGEKPNQEPPSWMEINYQINSSGDLGSFIWLDSIRGLRVKKVSYTPTEPTTYKIEGVIYVNK